MLNNDLVAVVVEEEEEDDDDDDDVIEVDRFDFFLTITGFIVCCCCISISLSAAKSIQRELSRMGGWVR